MSLMLRMVHTQNVTSAMCIRKKRKCGVAPLKLDRILGAAHECTKFFFMPVVFGVNVANGIKS